MDPRALLLVGIGALGLTLAWPRRAKAAGPASRESAIDAIESAYPATRGGLAAKIYDVAQRLGAHPYDLANQIAFESAFTFSPSIENFACRKRRGPDSGRCAVGLIQFLPSTAAELLNMDSEVAAYRRMAAMSAIEQMDYVERYYDRGGMRRLAGGVYDTPHKLALATFYPAYMNKDIDTPFPASAGVDNPDIDTPRSYVDAKLRKAKLSPSFELASRGEVFV